MSPILQQQTNGINCDDLPALAKQQPNLTAMLVGLYQIDVTLKTLMKDLIGDTDNAEQYYLKTELNGQCYNIFLYSSERKATTGSTILIADLLKKCEDKTIEYVVNNKISAMLRMFTYKDLSQTNINWID